MVGQSLLISRVKILPAWLNTRSIGADVAGTENSFFGGLSQIIFPTVSVIMVLGGGGVGV